MMVGFPHLDDISHVIAITADFIHTPCGHGSLRAQSRDLCVRRLLLRNYAAALYRLYANHEVIDRMM